MVEAVVLFKVQCETCKSRISVKSRSAIGQIFNCPKCGSMVQIEPPPGWVAPAPSQPAQAPEPTPTAAAEAKPQEDFSQTLADVADSLASDQVAAPQQQQPAGGYAPQPMAAQEQVESSSATVVLVIAAVAGVVILGTAIWSVWSLSSNSPDPALAEGPSEQQTTPVDLEKEPPEPKQEEPAEPDSSDPAEEEPKQPPEDKQPEPEEKDEPPQDPQPEPKKTEPNETKPPEGQGFKPIEPQPEPELPAAMPGEDEPEPQPKPELPKVDVAARLTDRLEAIEFSELPLSNAVNVISQMTSIPITFDLPALNEVGATPNDEVSANLQNVTVEELLRVILQQKRLAMLVEGHQLIITSPARSKNAMQEKTYPVADLVTADSQEGDLLLEMIRRLFEPPSWQEDSRVKLQLENGQLTLKHQVDVQQCVAELLTKLRLARGLPVKNPQVSLQPRSQQATEALLTKLTGNFSETPLERIAQHFERRAEITILFDGLALAELGLSPETPATLRAKDEQSLEEALHRLLDPLRLTYRVIDERTFEVTSQAEAAELLELEFYPVKDLITADRSAAELARQLTTQVSPNSWGENPSQGRVQFDAKSQTLIVFHNQSTQQRVLHWLEAFRVPEDVETQE